jgi:hypothetical protein
MVGLAKRKADNVVKRDLGTSETPRRLSVPSTATADGRTAYCSLCKGGSTPPSTRSRSGSGRKVERSTLW